MNFKIFLPCFIIAVLHVLILPAQLEGAASNPNGFPVSELQASVDQLRIDTAFLMNKLKGLQSDFLAQEVELKDLRAEVERLNKVAAEHRAFSEKERNSLKDIIQSKTEAMASLNDSFISRRNMVLNRDSIIQASKKSIASLSSERLDRIILGSRDAVFFAGDSIRIEPAMEDLVRVPFLSGEIKLDTSLIWADLPGWKENLDRFKRLMWHYQGKYKVKFIGQVTKNDPNKTARDQCDAVVNYLTQPALPFPLQDDDLSNDVKLNSNSSSKTVKINYVSLTLEK